MSSGVLVDYCWYFTFVVWLIIVGILFFYLFCNK